MSSAIDSESAPQPSLRERYRARLANTEERVSVGDLEGASRQSYIEAAAVLDAFTFSGLKPSSASAVAANPRALLFEDVVPVAGGDLETRYSLSLHVRQAALRVLGTRERMRRVLDSNPNRAQTEMQRLWEDYLESGTVPPLEYMRYQELTRLCQLLAWLDGLDERLPSVEAAENLMRRKSVFSSFEHLVSKDFVGREAELEMLHDHVGTEQSSGGVAAAIGTIRSWARLGPTPVLAIHGVGGIGKSALIGRFLLDQIREDDEAQFPFAYLAFDQPWLRVDAPHTLLSEVASQLELQYPKHRSAFKAFRDEIIQFRDARGSTVVGRERNIATRGPQGAMHREFDEKLFYAFGDLLHRIGQVSRSRERTYKPVVIVFDTFEEVQYRDREVLARFWRMLDQIQDAYPAFRAIICGRAAPEQNMRSTSAFGVKQVQLKELEEPDRVRLLERLGVTDDETAYAIAKQVGGSPLTLRLAADVAKRELGAGSSRGIENLSTRRLLFIQLDEKLIQGQLYQRILNHIHDERVRRLAHPGMVLRRVDPDVIAEVLAPVCMPELSSLDEAMEVFELLRQENTLVTVDSRDNSLVYRPDIRSSLLRLLERDRFDEVRRLRRAAVAYYQGLDGEVARNEELFHRLALGEDEPWQLDERVQDANLSSLAVSLTEFPDPMQAWLASRTSVEVRREVFQSTDLIQWERNTTRKVQLAIADYQFEEARKLLAERSDRSQASPLFALEVKLYLSVDKWSAAADAVLERGIDSVSGTSNRGRLAELYWLKAQWHLKDPVRNWRAADDCLIEAQRAMENASNPIPFLHILGQRLLLRHDHMVADGGVRADIEQRLAALSEALSTEQVHAAGLAAVLAWNQLSPVLYPAASRKLERALDAVSRGVKPDLLTDDLHGLDEYRELWERDVLQASRVATK